MTDKYLGSEAHETVGCIHLTELSATPHAPIQDTESQVYSKGNKFIIRFDDGGTMKYRYLDLTSTDATWTYTTTAP